MILADLAFSDNTTALDLLLVDAVRIRCASVRSGRDEEEVEIDEIGEGIRDEEAKRGGERGRVV